MQGNRVIGLERGIVRLAPYTNHWQRLFEEEKVRIQTAIGRWVLDIQHVGSTAIPGIVAKPILDIGVAVESFEKASVCIEPMERLGYEYRGENGIPRRHFFVMGDPRTHHVHVNEILGRDWENQIFFRDYLILHPEFAKQYTTLKLRLAERFPTDREAYLEGKAPFIERVLRLARSERANGIGVAAQEDMDE
jgi:GrpB-like predicted nucleotidyltransferase (UPF0157 family)